MIRPDNLHPSTTSTPESNRAGMLDCQILRHHFQNLTERVDRASIITPRMELISGFFRCVKNPTVFTSENVHQEQEKMEEKTTLGARLDVVEGEALPNFNELVLHFLRQSGMSVEQFRQCYGQAVKGRPYTKARIYQMIQEKSFPTDPKRRWAIAKLLQIPPLLLGVNALDDLLLELRAANESQALKEVASLVPGVKSVDLKEYRQALKSYSNLN